MLCLPSFFVLLSKAVQMMLVPLFGVKMYWTAFLLSSQINFCLFFFSLFLLLSQKRVVFLSVGGFQAISLNLRL